MKYKENIFAPYFVADPPETEMPPPVEESHESGRKSASDFIITIVILGVFILGAVIFVAVYIYRYVQL